MFRELRLTNFKRFGNRTTALKLAPITFLLGGNAAGKSSVLHALLALRQSAEAESFGFVRLLTDGPRVSLGRYANVVHRHDEEREVTLGLSFDEVDVDLSYGTFEEFYKTVRGQLNQAKVVRRTPQNPSGVVLGFDSDNGTDTTLTLSVRQAWSTGWKLPDTAKSELHLNQRQGTREWTASPPELLASASVVAQAPQEAGPAHFLLELGDHSLFRLNRKLADLRYIGPFRENVRRLALATGSRVEEVGARGEHLTDVLLSPGVLEEVGRMLERMDLGFTVGFNPDPIPVRAPVEELLVAHGSLPPVGLLDTGFGVSQLLPILTQLAAMRTGIERGVSGVLLVEQPEVHLHPRWQVALLRELASQQLEEGRVGSPARNQVILETHSEMMILAAMQLVRLGRVPADVFSVLAFHHDDDSGVAMVEPIGISEDGEFVGRWPDGFFPERDDLLLDSNLPGGLR